MILIISIFFFFMTIVTQASNNPIDSANSINFYEDIGNKRYLFKISSTNFKKMEKWSFVISKDLIRKPPSVFFQLSQKASTYIQKYTNAEKEYRVDCFTVQRFEQSDFCFFSIAFSMPNDKNILRKDKFSIYLYSPSERVVPQIIKSENNNNFDYDNKYQGPNIYDKHMKAVFSQKKNMFPTWKKGDTIPLDLITALSIVEKSFRLLHEDGNYQLSKIQLRRYMDTKHWYYLFFYRELSVLPKRIAIPVLFNGDTCDAIYFPCAKPWPPIILIESDDYERNYKRNNLDKSLIDEYIIIDGVKSNNKKTNGKGIQ